MLYGGYEQGQYRLEQWRVAWRNQAITWTNAHVS